MGKSPCYTLHTQMKSKLILFMLLFFFSPALRAARMPIQVKDFDFYNKENLKLYAGSKLDLRFNYLPDDVDLVQISIPGNFKKNIRVIGTANKAVEKSSLGNSVLFTIQMPELEEKDYKGESFSIKLKSFKKKFYLDHSYTILSTDLKTVDPIVCPSESKAVCGIVRTENTDKFYTFKNICEMEKYGGLILHDGGCLAD
jgi:hypothetical protein